MGMTGLKIPTGALRMPRSAMAGVLSAPPVRVGMTIDQFKGLFFRENRVLKQMDAATARAFRRFGARVRLTARHSLRKKKAGVYSRPGSPPHSHGRHLLRNFILYALARHPHLHARANDVADYFSTNYAFEWTQSPCTRHAILRARDMILSSAESEFGETPMASPLAYVYHHSNTQRVRNVSSYGECYARAAALVSHRHFHNYEQAWRERLGLHTLSHK